MSSAVSSNARYVSESQRRIDALTAALSRMETTTSEANRCCEQLAKRARHLDSLTSPASDASALLSKAATNISATTTLMKDAREKFDTMADCEPSIKKLHQGVMQISKNDSHDGSGRNHAKKMAHGAHNLFADGHQSEQHGTSDLAEQDVYAAADSMDIIRDAFNYFLERRAWKSALSALGGLERVHKMGVESMCALITHYLETSGQAAKRKHTSVDLTIESSDETRARLAAALQNRDLMKSIGEYEESQPLSPRPVREMRAIFECLAGDGWQLGKPRYKEIKSNLEAMSVPANKVVRNEKVGSGCFFNFVKSPVKTGYPHVDAYGEARKLVGHSTIEGYYRGITAQRKKKKQKEADGADAGLDADGAARDAVRCLEHAMVVVAGEKAVYRTVVGPSLVSAPHDDETEIDPLYKKACVAAYSQVAARVVDRTLDIIETVFLKECGIGRSSVAAKGDSKVAPLTVRAAASGAAAGLRMLDGVRMLGPSLAKICDMPIDGKKSSGPDNMAVASTLCISIHRTTVKNSARTLENLAKAIQEDSQAGPSDGRIASVSADVVRSIRLLSPYMSAYKSVTKRRALPWDPTIGEDAGDLDSYVKYLVMKLLSNLQKKGINYSRMAGDDAAAKGSIFMINNMFYLERELGPPIPSRGREKVEDEKYRIDSPWFTDKVHKIMASEKSKYLSQWEELNRHLSLIDKNALEFQKDKVLSLESGRIIKSRFSGFNEEFEQMYGLHKRFSVTDSDLRESLIKCVKNLLVPKYKGFYETYSKVQFSKKNMEQYLKFKPQKIDALLNELFRGSG